MLIKPSNGGKYSWFFPSLIVILFLVGLASSVYVFQRVVESGKESLVSRARTIAISLPVSSVEALFGSIEDLDSLAYANLKSQMVGIREVNADSRFVYIMGQRGGEVFFYVDSEPDDSEDYSAPGDIYEDNSPAIDAAFSDGIASVEGPIEDKFGNWISGISPIVDASDNVIAVVGIDVDANVNYRNAMTQAALPMLASFILIIFAYFGFQMRKREEDLLRLKSQFVAMATHEIRSPLTGIIWTLTEFIKRDVVPATEIEPVQRASNKLIDSVNDILYSFALETGDSLKAKIDLGEVIAHSKKSLETFAEKKQVVVEFNNQSKACVVGNSAELEHLFTNLISNAIKYSPDGRTVKISMIVSKRKAYIEISDQGIGIPQAEIGKVFSGFFRASNAIKFSESGTGLGLYISKLVATSHNGKITVESKEGQGTVMHVELPLCDI